jgi:rhodanese-related sulfurtransferase
VLRLWFCLQCLRSGWLVTAAILYMREMPCARLKREQTPLETESAGRHQLKLGYRNVLEWRFDPASSARLPVATDHDIQVIVFCSEGYTSSLAAITLQDLGLHRATDMIGGFQAWSAMGLPTNPPRRNS